jgi:hypothetical protein
MKLFISFIFCFLSFTASANIQKFHCHPDFSFTDIEKLNFYSISDVTSMIEFVYTGKKSLLTIDQKVIRNFSLETNGLLSKFYISKTISDHPNAPGFLYIFNKPIDGSRIGTVDYISTGGFVGYYYVDTFNCFYLEY